MLDALVSGTTDPEVLADLARGKLRKKLPALKEALEGRFEGLHALLIGAILSHLDFLDEQIDRLSDAIEQQIVPLGLRWTRVSRGSRDLGLLLFMAGGGGAGRRVRAQRRLSL